VVVTLTQADLEVRAEIGATELGDEFLPCVAFVTPLFSAAVTIEAALVFR